ncbi:MAG: hypothetical protein ACPGTU_00855 [Myxococcota bacterium]
MPKIDDLMEWIDPSRWPIDATDARSLLIIIGIVFLFAGNRFYRFVIIAPGFVVGVLLANHYSPTGDPMTQAGIKIGAGLVGAVLMHLMEKSALRLIGVALMVGLAQAVAPEVFGKKVPWWLNYASGAIGAVVFPIIYERALPLITSLLGALTMAWALERETDLWMIGILTFIGTVSQVFLAGQRR